MTNSYVAKIYSETNRSLDLYELYDQLTHHTGGKIYQSEIAQCPSKDSVRICLDNPCLERIFRLVNAFQFASLDPQLMDSIILDDFASPQHMPIGAKLLLKYPLTTFINHQSCIEVKS